MECKPRLGILTLTQSENYGTVLQAYASLKLISQLLPEYEIAIVKSDVAKVRRRRVASLLNPLNPNFGLKRIFNFLSMRRFIKSEVAPRRGYVNFGSRKKALTYLQTNYEALITGSDEIWNLVHLGFSSVYYVPSSFKGPRASFATSANRIDPAILAGRGRSILKDSLSRYTFISVRDSRTRSLVTELTGSQPPEVLDPTLLYDFSEIPESIKQTDQKDRILLMVKDRQIGRKLVQSLSKIASIDAVFIKHKGSRLLSLSPEEFLHVFGQYRLVITDFYHGTCMAVRKRCNFICFDSEPGYAEIESKIENLLTKLSHQGSYRNLSKLSGESAASEILDLAIERYNKPQKFDGIAEETYSSLRRQSLLTLNALTSTFRDALENPTLDFSSPLKPSGK